MTRRAGIFRRGVSAALAAAFVMAGAGAPGAQAAQTIAVFHVGLRIAPHPVLPAKGAGAASKRQLDGWRAEAPVLKARVPVLTGEDDARRTFIRLVIVY